MASCANGISPNVRQSHKFVVVLKFNEFNYFSPQRAPVVQRIDPGASTAYPLTLGLLRNGNSSFSFGPLFESDRSHRLCSCVEMSI